MLLEVTGKVLFDSNIMYSSIVHRIHDYCYRSLLLILFTVYTITVDCYTVSLLSSYLPSVISNMVLIVMTELNNNVNGQLILGLGKLMEETTSVFWVDLIQVAQPTEGSLQGSWGMTDIPSVLLLFNCSYSEIIVIEYLVVRSGSTPRN